MNEIVEASLSSLVGRLADEFTERLQRGEQPDIEDYARRFPGQEAAVRQILTALLALHSAATPPSPGEALEAKPGPAAGSSVLPITIAEAVNQQEVSQPFDVLLDGYVLLEELGRGGMGVVYKARHKKLKRLVALKMILAGAHGGPQNLDRFRLEAEAIARLQHPNIVQIYEVGEQDGKPYLALEYVDGGSLRARLAGAPLPPVEAARLIETLARAIQYAHQQGIIHRDLKPANILLQRLATDGHRSTQTQEKNDPGSSSLCVHLCSSVANRPLKITDFGLAKQLGEDSGQTQAGQILGTPSYMAPEQAVADNRTVGPAADIHALGAMLYEMLTGRPPFKAATVLDTLELVRMQEPVPPGQLQPKTPRDLETICLKCLQKDPARRYGSALDLADDLQRFQKGEPIHARPVGPVERFGRWCRRNPVVASLSAAVTVVLLASTAIAWYLTVDAIWEKNRADANAAKESLARQDADTNAVIAKANEERATNNATETRRALERSDVARGWDLMDHGDIFQAQLWFARPLQGFHGSVVEEDSHRLRLAYVTRMSGGPTLLHALVHKGNLVHTEFSPDGRRVLTASWDGTAQVWDAFSGQPLGPPLKHEKGVVHAEFSADGIRVVTASFDGTARVWKAATGRVLTPPLRHKDQLFWATFSPDGRRVVTASLDHTARVWDVATGQPITPPLPHKGQVEHATFSPDGTRVVTASTDSTAQVWDATTGSKLTPALQHTSFVKRGAFSPDGTRIVTASWDRTARVWDAATGKELVRLQHQGAVAHAAFSPDGSRVVTASWDHTARVWEAATGRALTGSLQHQGFVHHATFSPDGRRILTASSDHTARVWDAATGRPLTPPVRHQAMVQHVAFSPDGRRFVTASVDYTARVWDAATGQTVIAPGQHQYGVNQAAYSPDGRRIVTAGGDSTARVWNSATGQLVLPPLRHLGDVRHAEFSPDGQRIVTASVDRTARIWDAATGKELTPPLVHQDQVSHAAFSPDSTRVVTASMDQTARVWNALTGKALTPPLQHQGWVRHAEFSPEGDRVITASSDHTGRVWNATSGQAIAPPLGHKTVVEYAAFSPDGRHVVTASSGWNARVFDAATGAGGKLMRHQQGVRQATFSKDGRRIVTASGDKTARVWDAATAEPISPPLPHQETVICAAFSPNGRLVVTTSYDKTARVWDAVSGQPLSPPLQHDDDVNHAVFSPNGRQVATASRDGTLRLWDVSPDDRLSEDWLKRVQLLWGGRLDRYGAATALTAKQMGDLLPELRAKYPQEFTVPPVHVFAWHRREMEASVKEKHALGVILHYHYSTPHWLIPTDGWGTVSLGALLAAPEHHMAVPRSGW